MVFNNGLLAALIIGRFAGDGDIVGMAFDQTGSGDADQAGSYRAGPSRLAAPAQPIPERRTANQLLNEIAEGAFVREHAFHSHLLAFLAPDI